MKFGKIILLDWTKNSPTRWVRNSLNMFEAPVNVVKIYSIHSTGYAWYPMFLDNFEFLTNVYKDITNSKEFKYNEEQLAMQFVDEFLIRVNK